MKDLTPDRTGHRWEIKEMGYRENGFIYIYMHLQISEIYGLADVCSSIQHPAGHLIIRLRFQVFLCESAIYLGIAT